MLRKLVYRFYQQRLEAAVRAGDMPQHVGVVLDGNRRFARKNGLLGFAGGHRAGADKAEELLAWCDDLGIPVVTIWALSTDNFKRDPDRKSTRLNSSHIQKSRMPSSA